MIDWFAVGTGVAAIGISGAIFYLITKAANNQLPQVTEAISKPFQKEPYRYARKIYLATGLKHIMVLPEGQFEIKDAVEGKSKTNNPKTYFKIFKYGETTPFDHPSGQWDEWVEGDTRYIKPTTKENLSRKDETIQSLKVQLSRANIRIRSMESEKTTDALPDHVKEVIKVEKKTKTAKAGTMDENRGADAQQDDANAAKDDENGDEPEEFQ